MSETAVSAVEATTSAIAGKVTTATGAGVTIASWATAIDWGFWIGVGIGLIGLLISLCNYITNLKFQRKKDKREEEIHELTKKQLQGQCDVSKE
ncbi:hypothetical protein [Acinetobacter sp. ANC 4648]|uniref:hypothetical protein n=1 Tax=Acinetobacter sp. ANC 4648 TaxID=1977875 RepID=UPI000A3307F3|nr:hypothetical protein [Acinetobacter sp. ANC 4648]OTG82157.1 hypothetical protein B9T27_07845 [Acinetobacter sp. ANC 4648]